MEQGLLRLAVSVAAGVVSVSLICFAAGLTGGERQFIINAIRPRLLRLRSVGN